MTAPREIDKSDQHARRAMWEDFFTRRCPTARDVINSAVGALVLRDAVSKVGSHKVRKTFDLWQTPTTVTRSILENETIEEIVGAYAQWCFELNSDYAQDHLDALNRWLHDHSAWNIEFYEM